MKIVFRADASLRIGSGHVMRCLSLADALRAQGDTSLFLCRAWPGHLGATIRAHGHALHLLPAPAEEDATSMLSALTDAEACLQLLANEGVIDCLLLDHYALDPRWLRAVRASGRCRQLLVIDDLAEHAYADEADILLDPNLGALKRRTRQLTPLRPTTNAATHPGRHLPNTTCRYLLGPRFALLRPEFSSLREATLARRLNSKPGVKAASETKRLLVFLGGGQTDALSLSVLNAIRASGIAQSSAHNNPWQIDLVLGGQAEGAAAAATRAQIEAQRHDWPQLRLHAMTPQMAQLMAQADLMIGAGGGPSWERCCLGLPALILSIAENQIDN
ncbi:MAG: UDP-2,4-diacetamido-2,4,6-trideoxy-beta-L-altropyranose hydrolase, partial [Pseudomonadota bacterium]